MSSEKQRADVALHAQGLAESREKARALIEAGLAFADGVTIAKPSQSIADDTVLTARGEVHPYVSRGGLKLAHALDGFSLNSDGLICMDVGASTGGFTDVLLRRGASRVYAIDVGHSQLDARIRENPRVTVMERVNARTLAPDLFPEKPSLAVIDVSFISVTLIVPAVANVLGEDGRIVALIKPQFEAGRGKVGKKGIVTDPKTHAEVIRAVAGFAESIGWRMRAVVDSPIAGSDGNIEFLAELCPARDGGAAVDEARIAEAIAHAHAAMKPT